MSRIEAYVATQLGDVISPQLTSRDHQDVGPTMSPRARVQEILGLFVDEEA